MSHEQLFNGVGESSSTDAQYVQNQLAQPKKVPERMVEKNSLDASVMAHPSESSTASASAPEADALKLDRVFTEGCGGGKTASLRRDLGILGMSTRTETKKVRAKNTAFSNYDVKAVEICRLLNSTTLGQVIDERQLYRHRLRAGNRIQNGHRVNLLQYIAWLAEVRHFNLEVRNDPIPQPGSVTASKVLKLLELQQYRCALTGRKLFPMSAALDHVLPISRSGTNNIENAQVLHADVNRAKGAQTNDEFVALCREVAAWADKANTRVHGANGRKRSPTQTKGST